MQVRSSLPVLIIQKCWGFFGVHNLVSYLMEEISVRHLNKTRLNNDDECFQEEYSRLEGGSGKQYRGFSELNSPKCLNNLLNSCTTVNMY